MTILSQELNFDEFGNEFQVELIHSIYNDKNFFVQINDILEEEYFTYEVCKEIFRIFKEFYKKYKCLPSFEDMKIIINENKNEMMRTLLYRELSNFEKINKSRNFSFINERALEFCKRQKLKKSILICNELANEENSDEKIRKILNDALNAGQSKDIGHEYIESLYSRYNVNKRKPITTNWPYLNKVLKGGLSAGELLLIIGSVGKGKSHFLINMGEAAFQSGLNVVHYTLELLDVNVGRRYDSLISGIGVDDLDDNYAKVNEAVEKVKAKGGKLIIKQYAPRTASVQTMRAHLDKLAGHGFKADVIIVDYIDLVKTASHYSERRHELEGIVEDLRAFGQEYGAPIYSCTQVNRGGYSESVVTLDNIAEAFSKTFAADVVITFSRNNDGKEDGNTGNLLLAKNRLGRDGILFPFIIDTAQSKIVVGKPYTANNESIKKVNEAMAAENEIKTYEEGKK